LLDEFAGKINLMSVYITEAHAHDEWPISSGRFTLDGVPVILNQPKSTEERLEAAKQFKEHYNFRVPILVDPIEDGFDKVFAPWPLRFYILDKGKLVYKAQPKDCSYDIAELRNKILELVE
jgi:Iodothyronine deiodinase